MNSERARHALCASAGARDSRRTTAHLSVGPDVVRERLDDGAVGLPTVHRLDDGGLLEKVAADVVREQRQRIVLVAVDGAGDGHADAARGCGWNEMQ